MKRLPNSRTWIWTPKAVWRVFFPVVITLFLVSAAHADCKSTKCSKDASSVTSTTVPVIIRYTGNLSPAPILLL